MPGMMDDNVGRIGLLSVVFTPGEGGRKRGRPSLHEQEQGQVPGGADGGELQDDVLGVGGLFSIVCSRERFGEGPLPWCCWSLSPACHS